MKVNRAADETDPGTAKGGLNRVNELRAYQSYMITVLILKVVPSPSKKPKRSPISVSRDVPKSATVVEELLTDFDDIDSSQAEIMFMYILEKPVPVTSTVFSAIVTDTFVVWDCRLIETGRALINSLLEGKMADYLTKLNQIYESEECAHLNCSARVT